MFGLLKSNENSDKIPEVNEKTYDKLIEYLVGYCDALEPTSDEYQETLDKIDTLNKAKVELIEAKAKANQFDWVGLLKVLGSVAEVTMLMVYEYNHVIASRNALNKVIKL